MNKVKAEMMELTDKNVKIEQIQAGKGSPLH